MDGKKITEHGPPLLLLTKNVLSKEMKYQNHFPNDNPTEPPFNDPKFCGKVKVPQNSSVLPVVVRRLGWYPKEAGG